MGENVTSPLSPGGKTGALAACQSVSLAHLLEPSSCQKRPKPPALFVQCAAPLILSASGVRDRKCWSYCLDSIPGSPIIIIFKISRWKVSGPLFPQDNTFYWRRMFTHWVERWWSHWPNAVSRNPRLHALIPLSEHQLFPRSSYSPSSSSSSQFRITQFKFSLPEVPFATSTLKNPSSRPCLEFILGTQGSRYEVFLDDCNRELSSQSTVSFVSLVWKSGFLLWQIEKSKRGKRQREKAPSSCLDRWTRRLHSLKSDNWPTCVESHGCSVLCFFCWDGVVWPTSVEPCRESPGKLHPVLPGPICCRFTFGHMLHMVQILNARIRPP